MYLKHAYRNLKDADDNYHCKYINVYRIKVYVFQKENNPGDIRNHVQRLSKRLRKFKISEFRSEAKCPLNVGSHLPFYISIVQRSNVPTRWRNIHPREVVFIGLYLAYDKRTSNEYVLDITYK